MSFFNNCKKTISRIHLVDKFLILYMVIFLLHNAHTLMDTHIITEDMNSVDGVIRTSAAAVFGYFLSANFAKSYTKSPAKNEKSKNIAEIDTTDNVISPINSIGFDTAKSETESESESKLTKSDLNIEYSDPPVNSNSLQIVFAAAMGLFSIAVLLIIRRKGSISPYAPVTMSQLRDFISSCVGFLIGCNTDNSGKNKQN